MYRIKTSKFEKTNLKEAIDNKSVYIDFSYNNEKLQVRFNSLLMESKIGDRTIKYVITIPMVQNVTLYKEYDLLMNVNKSASNQIGLTSIINELDGKFDIIDEYNNDVIPLLLYSDKNRRLVNVLTDKNMINAKSSNDKIATYKDLAISFGNSVKFFTKINFIKKYGYQSKIRCDGFNIFNIFAFNINDERHVHITSNVSSAISYDGNVYNDKYIRGYNFVL